ncbi:hypothetical protein NSK11_contig00171-0002 [Nocardia seriolae]|uniref:Secreted protein n=1 Tax=Nocardia seriolae TaxID=37332 RepID=A0ABC9Z6D9_9NOCA|nr:hypothetical protein NSERKGN1266_19450 [Nocardia seriolae]BEK98068.1 hypothetical protein NSER024013_59740 [Nocardia seriolae]GAM50702.1 hypothetical protein NS07_v2contig00168-0014 [Nocardia seriolae]GAP32648.1 hypothetical protein NSK11_contig00171-0002 [Nocardia seriolae]GEM28297.1 hypothetical protein NS2_65360 [Nocardia seriolae NBRC 15557]
MRRNWHSTDAVIVSVAAAATAVVGLDWAHAVIPLPSIDSPNMHAWNGRQHATTDRPRRTVVTPSGRFPNELDRLPHPQICVPPSEFATFTALLGNRR